MGPWPEARYYDPDGMKPAMRKDFDNWYQNRATSPIQFARGNGSLLSIGRSSVESRVRNLSTGICHQSRFQPHGEMRHHRLGLHAVLPQKPFARPYPGLGTSLRLEWETRTTIPESLPMVGIGKFPTDRGGHRACVQRGQTDPSSRAPSVSSGRVQRRNPDRVRVSRVFMARVSQVFRWQPGQDHPSPPRTNQTGIVRSHHAKTSAIAKPRLPRDRLLGMSVGPIASTTRRHRHCDFAPVPRALARPT